MLVRERRQVGADLREDGERRAGADMLEGLSGFEREGSDRRPGADWRELCGYDSCLFVVSRWRAVGLPESTLRLALELAQVLSSSRR